MGEDHQAFIVRNMETGCYKNLCKNQRVSWFLRMPKVYPQFRRMPAHFGNRVLRVSKLPLSLPTSAVAGISLYLVSDKRKINWEKG
jgi:hypothetical protein